MAHNDHHGLSIATAVIEVGGLQWASAELGMRWQH